MARHVFVGLLVVACLLQIALSVPARERRDVDSTTAEPANLLEGIERFADDLKKKTQEFFTGDSFRAIQRNATNIGEQISAAFNDLVDSARNLAPTSSPAAGAAPAA